MLLVVAVVLIIMYMLVQHDPARVYRFGDATLPHVTVIAGTHGNEPAPSRELDRLVEHLKLHPDEAPRGMHLVVVPRVNPAALRRGVREVDKKDLNRCWPDLAGHYGSPIRALIDRSALVIDFHEAWSTEAQDPGSLGQTIYTTAPQLYDPVAIAMQLLNRLPVSQWRRVPALPQLADGRALDEYCLAQAIPYVLVETAGQADIVPMALRQQQVAVVLKTFLGVSAP